MFVTFFALSRALPTLLTNSFYSRFTSTTNQIPVDRRHRVAGLMEVIIYSSPDDKKKNRGFCFLEYESHKAASLAKRRLGTGRIKVRLLPLFFVIIKFIIIIMF
jgi:hypothetical protein